MNRAVAMSAASVLCLFWAAGCASTDTPGAKSAAGTPATNAADAEPNASSDVATLTKNLPGNLEGEIHRAQLLRSKGDYDDAARSLAQLMLVDPDDARVVGEYGKVLEQQGRSQEALAFLKRAVELQQHDATMYSALGVAYDQLDKHAEARTAYEHALALKPGDASILNNYAVSRMLAGDLKGAQHLLAQASGRDAANPKIAQNITKLAGMEPPVMAASVEPAVASPKVPPLPSSSSPLPNVHGRIVVAKQKTQPPAVVMQRVPVDPLAGPIANSHGTAHKLASTDTHKTKHLARKTEPSAPSLRTASDRD